MESIILIVSAFITSSISAVLGMGGGIILLGIMAIIIPEGYMVIALHGVIQLVSNTTRTYVFKNHIKWSLIKEFFIGAIIGLFASALIIIFLVQLFNVASANEIKVEILKPVIGIFIIWYLFFKRSNHKISIKSFFWVGGISGISSVFVGATGPLIAPFFLDHKLTKENIIANKAACQVISHLGKIPIFIYFFNVNYLNQLNILMPLALAVFLGTNLGKQLLRIIPESTFRKLFRYTLLIIAIKLVLDNIIQAYL